MIGRITTTMVSQTTLADIESSYDRLQTTQQQLSSGKRINQPSDDPYGTSMVLQLNNEIANLGSYSTSITDGTSWSQAADTSLSNINNMVARVRELAVQGGNGTLSASDRADIASEVDQLTDAIKQEANTQYAGQYIFSGTKTTTSPYATGSNDAFAGNTAAINRGIAPNTTVQVNADLSSVLGGGQGAADGKLLDTLRTISADLRSGSTASVSALSGSDLQNLDANTSNLQQLQAQVGATEDRLQLAASRISDLQDTDTTALSGVQDADMAQTITDYSSEQAAYTAALRAGASIVQSSLLDFLK